VLTDQLKILLASQFAYYLKAQYFHWNVEGSDFAQLHEFFSDIYEDAYSAVDPIAEYIRALEEYTPGSLSRFAELSLIPDQTRPNKSTTCQTDDPRIVSRQSNNG